MQLVVLDELEDPETSYMFAAFLTRREKRIKADNLQEALEAIAQAPPHSFLNTRLPSMKWRLVFLILTLALDGGRPVRTASFPPWPYFAEDEIAAAEGVLRSGKVNYWTGEEGRLFEREFAAFTGCRYAVALANGTVALEAALYALGIGPGDDVIVPCRTFIASASCAVMRGARPVGEDPREGFS